MLKIAQITDLHLLENSQDAIYGINPYSNLRKIVSKLVSIKGIDCIIITGDIANKGEYEAYINANKLLDRLAIPKYWLQGNHDYLEVMLQVSGKVNIKLEKSFKIKETKFVLLHTVMKDEGDLSMNKARGYLFDYELSFLKRELDENNFDHCIIALHHPPILSNTWTDRRILDNKDEFISLIKKYPKVKVVLYGHQHLAQSSFVNGITFISAPPASYHYNPNGPPFSLLTNMQGFGIIELKKDGHVLYEEYFI